MTSLLRFVVYLAVLAPLLTLVHELSHVAVTLALVPQDVIVRIGARPTVQLLKWGRLQVLVQLWGCAAGRSSGGTGRFPKTPLDSTTPTASGRC